VCVCVSCVCLYNSVLAVALMCQLPVMWQQHLMQQDIMLVCGSQGRSAWHILP
jgi:hypothetical protein